MIVSYYTDVGCVRKENEDSVFAKELDGGYLLIVADGMGGHNGGKTASRIAIDEISSYVTQNYRAGQSGTEIEDLLRTAISEANMRIYSAAFKDDKLRGMGTTVVSAIVSENKLYTANVGDSRLYILSNGVFRQITTDHSYVESLVSKGIISKSEAKTHPQKNIITRAVGSDDSVEIDFFENSLSKNDIVLICTDGLHTMVDEEDIIKILSENIQDASRMLVSLANKNGGRDNISVIAVKIN